MNNTSHYLLDTIILLVVLFTPNSSTLLDSNSSENNSIKKEVSQHYQSGKIDTVKNTISRKDSLLKVANQSLDNTIKISIKTVSKKEELEKIREAEREALKKYITEVDKYLEQTGIAKKTVLKTDLKTQLKKGEVFLQKDSTCNKYTRHFLGKKKCVEWQYSWYISDENGIIEKLW